MEDAVTRVFTWSSHAEVVTLHTPKRNAGAEPHIKPAESYALS